MFYTWIWYNLPQKAKTVIALSGVAGASFLYMGDNSLLPAVGGLDEFNKSSIEARAEAEAQDFKDSLLPCGTHIDDCELRENNPRLYAALTEDGTPITVEKVQQYKTRMGWE